MGNTFANSLAMVIDDGTGGGTSLFNLKVGNIDNFTLLSLETNKTG